MSEKPPAFWLPLLWRSLAAFVLAAPGLALNAWERSLDAETRFTPRLSDIQGILYQLPLLSLVLAAVFLIRHTSASTRSFSRLEKVAWIFVVVLAQVAFAFAAMLAGAFNKPNWLFGPGKPEIVLPSPNGQRTAYASSSCIFNFCSLDIHVQEGRELTMRRIHHFDQWNRTAPSWLPDSSDVQVPEKAATPSAK